MIADTVSGVSLLWDPDFNPGDTVTTDSVTGTVESKWTWKASPEGGTEQ